MGNPDRFTWLGQAFRRTPRGDRDSSGAEELPRESNLEPLFATPDEPDDADALLKQARGPARGFVLGLIPALLVWAALIGLVAFLLKQ